MKQLFLYRLFKHSLAAFIFIIAFICMFIYFFNKKMDMVLFPYNSMYAVDLNTKYVASTYAFKLNRNLVKITQNPYWKKDFLEASLLSFAKYKQNNDEVYMQQYLQAVIPNKETREVLSNRLSPSKSDVAHWPAWYIRFAGYSVNDPDSIQLLKYDFIIKDNKFILKDSNIIELSAR